MRSSRFRRPTATTPTFKTPVAGVAFRVFTLLFVWMAVASSFAASSVVDLRCENRVNPLGIDVLEPRLSWTLTAKERNKSQTAYRVLVASSARNLRADEGDLWDSGKIPSQQSLEVRYAGNPLSANTECFWKVCVWDESGKSTWSKPASWSMGLLAAHDWKALWIGLEGEDKTNWLSGTDWIWFPEGEPAKSAPPGERYFRRTFALPEDRQVQRARFLFTGDNECHAFINGRDAGSRNNYHIARDSDVTFLLRPGNNVIALLGKNRGTQPKAAGVAALLQIEFDRGEPMKIATDEQWRSRDKEQGDWKELTYDDRAWRAAKKLGPVGMDPWKNVRAPEDRRLAARWLRKDFQVGKKISRATLYASGLGISELYLNGSKVGDHVLSPALAEYPKRIFYVTFDVTDQVRRGENAIGAILGNGRFYAPRSQVQGGTQSYGFPKLLLQLRIEHTDGSVSEIVSDGSWKLTANGPIVANNEYDGEEFDARKKLTGWSKPGFDASKWQPVEVVPAPPGRLAAQMIEPIRVAQTLEPVGITEPRPGVFIFDFGQNLVGWTRLRVSGPASTRIILRHAETLRPDGTLYVANLRSAEATDIYTLKGGGPEIWEPRFTYHGFRYVEVTGFPGKPTARSLEARVVHDDLESAGTFECSNPVINRVYQNVVWGTKGNYRSIPTDCPQRDERQGWLGDRSEESKGESFMFNTQSLYEKWLQDIADAQKESGSVPDVAPAYWPIYSDNVTWPSSTVIIPNALYQQFADTAVLEQHYESAANWINYMTTNFYANGLISRDKYGDWCVPPEDPQLIHSKDPKRQTDKTLLASAYFYHDLRLMNGYAARLGKTNEAERFDKLADQMKTAFNDKFLKRDSVKYDNGSQTSFVLPLAFGLVPEELRGRLFDHLVQKIVNDSKGHIGTGLIGGQYLMRVLTDNGRPDVAYRIASQKDYPSWGYMAEQGATTIWELWNGNTADPAMNSGNHVMLVGDLVIWLYENLAGIKTDPQQPGFKHILMRPEPVGNLQFVKASHRSPFGLITSEWHRNDTLFDWKIEVPANTTATIYIPAKGLATVTESGKSIGNLLPTGAVMKDGRAVLHIGSGKYHFISR